MAVNLTWIDDEVKKAGGIKIIDIGAMDTGGDGLGDPLYSRGLCSIIGFEPVKEECEKLNRAAGKNRVFLPYAIGDGEEHDFHICNFPMTSSIYKPNKAVTTQYFNLDNLMQVVKTERIKTFRLDDIPELRSGVDYVKMDIQGAELMAIEGGKNLMKNILLLETEVEFVPHYENQPLFADLDIAARSLGFYFLQFKNHAFGSRPFVPLTATANSVFTQALWSDAIYVRGFPGFQSLSNEQMYKLIAICHYVYHYHDFCVHILHYLDQRNGTALAQRYFNEVILAAKAQNK